MSTAMDFSPLKMESTPSAHSSPHRTPLKASPLRSPPGEEMDPSSYGALGFGRGAPSFCGSGSGGARSKFTVARDMPHEGGTDPTPSRVNYPRTSPTLVSDDSRSSSPVIAHFLSVDEAEKNSCNPPGDHSRKPPSPGPGEEQTPNIRKQHADPARDPRFIVDKTLSTTRGDDEGEYHHNPDRPTDDMRELSDAECGDAECDDSVVELKDEYNNCSASSDKEEEEDDDQIECAECSKVFCNLQRYMDHTCYRSQPRCHAPGDKTLAKPSPPTFPNRDSPLGDAEIFKGRIVYNPNGSAYIIEGNGFDNDLELKLPLLPDSIIVREGQSVMSVERSIPKIANAVFFSRRDRPSFLHSSSDDLRDPEVSRHGPAVHSYNVYELRNSEIDDLLELFPSYQSASHAAKPILMCFICRLSFGNPRSFLRHIMYDHSMELNEGEKTLLCRPNASALIQACGKEKYPTVSVLQHIRGLDGGQTDCRSSNVLSNAKTHEWARANANFLHSPVKVSSLGESMFSYSLNHEDRKSGSPGQEHQENAVRDESSPSPRSSVSGSVQGSLNREHFLQKQQGSDSDYISGVPFLYSTQGQIRDSSSPKRQRTSPATPSPQLAASSPSNLMSPESFYQPTSTPNSSISNMMMSSANAAGLHQHLGLTSANTLQSMGLSMSNFFGSCDEHPQGRAQGVECPKCDMVLGSTQSLGGHMTMTHSRNSCKTLKCPKCNWHYKYQETLEIHMKEKHPDSDAQCVYCLTNQSHPRLARGESYSCGYKPYRCEVCNYSTTTKGNLSIHMQSDKHINNMQDLANGSSEMKMQPPPSPAAPSLPPIATTPTQHSAPSFSQDDSQYKKLKQKQTFRCDVCSYETSVARNLRIHMTSEKHTHNMLVMTQSINHLHQDMTLHQINQMNQLFALNQQEQAARFAAISPHLAPNMFSYEQTAMLVSATSNPPPSQVSFEMPMNLTKDNGADDSFGTASAKDATKLFQCCICNKYGSDSIENIHNHIQYDRTKSGNSDAHVTYSGGAYHCNLCTYKTHLKANFQLHCKTDKHLQKLQLVNHVQEGGIENEWRLTLSGSPMQIFCNACSFYANSTHKMQLHLSTIQHEACSQLFRHLQLLDHATPAAPAPGRLRYYQCSLCSANVRTKQKLVLHSRAPHHVRKEQSLPQGHVSIFDVYLIKETSDGASVEFEDAESDSIRQGFLQHLKADDDTLDGSSDVTEGSPRHLGSSGYGGKVSAAALPPHATTPTTTTTTTAAAASSSLGSSAGATDYSVFRIEPAATKSSNTGKETLDALGVASRPAVLTNRKTSQLSGDSADVTNGPGPYDKGQAFSPQVSQAAAASSFSSPQPACAVTRPAARTPCILCPLCRHECTGAAPLEEHLIKEHNVAQEGIQRLMSMVDIPAPDMAAAESTTAPSPPLSSSTSDNNNASSLSSKLTAAGSNSSLLPAGQFSEKAFGKSEQSRPEVNDTKRVSSSAAPQAHKSTPEPFRDVIASGPTSATPPATPQIVAPHMVAPHIASPHMLFSSPSSSLVSSNAVPEHPLHAIRTLSPRDEAREINLGFLEEEHTTLLAKEGLDIVAQEKLDREYEDMFRCQTCNKSFINIDQLYCHQNELGHLELKQTPRGPGYLCWKKGCNQYFKTALTLQVHFREIHAKKSLPGALSAHDLEAYKFKCGQCSYNFRSLEAMQRHTLIHLMQSVTHCRICSRRLSSVAKMRRHLETVHGDLSLADMTVQMESIEANASLLFSSPAYEQFTVKMLMVNGNASNKLDIAGSEEDTGQGKLTNGLDIKENVNDHDVDDGDVMSDYYREKQFLEDYMNSQSMAEEHYKDVNRKFKCNRCKVAFTNQRYLFAHNKTSQHRQGEQADKFDDPSRPYRCEICKESFTQKNILMVHYNSVSHLHKLKQHNHLNGEGLVYNTTSGSHSTPPPLSPSVNVNSPSTAAPNGGFDGSDSAGGGGSSSTTKPYKCNICKVSYNNQPSIEIHLRSVGHKTKASKLSELIQTGQVDVHQALIEHPDPRTAGKQQAQIIADMIHQQATAQAASNATATYFNLQGMQGLNAMAQLSLLQGIIPSSSHHMLSASAQNALAAMSTAQLEAYYSSINQHYNHSMRESQRGENAKVASSKDKPVRSNQDSDKIVNMVIKQDGKIEPAGGENKSKMGIFDGKISGDPKNAKKEEELPPNFPHAPILARPRGFMGRFKPQLHRSLLENYGFECVMHFNEEHSVEKAKPKEDKENDEKNKDDVIGADENGEKHEDVEEKMEVENSKEDNKEEEAERMQEKMQESECEESKEDNRDENKENIDLPELGKCKCHTCNKDFSNVWVLKNHEEEVHNHFVSPAFIEDFGKKFKEDWEKNLPKISEHECVGSLQMPSDPTTPTNVEKAPVVEMPPPPPPAQPQMPTGFDMAQLSQLLPLMGLNMLPMQFPMNLVNLGLSNSMMPSLMMPTMDLSQGFLSQMQPPSLVDASSVSSQQQMQAAAAAAAQNQKRVRTRISDDQLKVLRQYFDINNSPSEEQINKMSDQTGLPQKVIKHWFRNTLFKERQRNKDSPYNFNNPPSTSIDLDEYDRTGKIPEVKQEPEEEEEVGNPLVPEVKKETPVVKVENAAEKDEDQEEDLQEHPPLKIDYPPKSEMSDECKRDQESHSNTSSPSNMSSIPSTPTASAPATPTPMITNNPMNTLAFSLESYAANIARLEAATFQNMGKRANRTRFTDYQIKTLQDYFERNAYPKDDELEHLSKILGLSARVIVVWFQNARQKARKIYENQPTAENPKEIASPFQRTPGLNYQCKKCNSVFQRYYELIKHQKNSCVGESNNNNNKSIHSMMEDDSNFSYSNDDSNFSDRQGTPSAAVREREVLSRSQQDIVSPPSSTTVKPPSATSSSASIPQPPVVVTSAPSSASSLPTFKCDKCSMTFSRFDVWQEHQKSHSVAPAMYTPFSSSSAFGMLQTLAHQEDSKAALSLAVMTTPSSLLPSMVSAPLSASHQSASMTTTPNSSSTSPSPSSKRKTDSEDESGEQPRDKRLRTTILPEQLDYLYQQYQIDCNPSRKQLEHIASTVNLKKRVVQVWFQNTRARERKGHYRAHQQLINKRCPFCRALFRAKSALESHLATKHPEEMAKGDINIDLIPDAMIEPPTGLGHSSLSLSSGHGTSHSDISKLLPPGAAATMPNYMAFMSSAGALSLPFPSPTPEMLGHPSFEDPFFKKYMSELASSMSARQEHNAARQEHNAARQEHNAARQELNAPHSSHSTQSSTSSTNISAHSTPKPSHQPPPSNFNLSSRPLDAHKPKSSPQPAVAPPPPPPPPPSDDAPLDLSKPVKSLTTSHSESSSRISTQDFSERAMELEYLRRLNSLDDSFSETQSEMADNEYMNDVGGSPPSPSHTSNGSLHLGGHTPGSSGKRYRTQMSATQVKVMKHLFQDYKTPTMAECELLGQEIGLAKRVVQVWFQNARAKEKKAKLNSGKPFNAELDFPKSPEDCKLCNYKYSHKVTVQDHIFTKTHIDRVKTFLHSENDRDLDLSSGSLSGLSRTPGETDRAKKYWDDSLSSSHLAQLQAMGINTTSMGYPLGPGESSSLKSQEKSETVRKEKKHDGAMSKEEQQQQVQAAMELAMNAQMMSALGGYMPGLDPAYLSYMYGGLPGYFPGMGLSLVQPGLMPGAEHMMAYDPLAYGTPLSLLQIPAAAIKSVSEKLAEAGAVLARYTQDCQALADLHSVVSAADLTVAAEATLDVGYICKKCQMVYPARESCVAHQRAVCLAASASLPKGYESIMKLEQVQYECRACNERFSTILEFKVHCQQEAHKTRLMKFKAKEAARRESAGSPSSSAPYSLVGKALSPSSSSYMVKSRTTTSPTNNNNVSHNNNQVNAPIPAHSTKPLVPSPAHQYNKMAASSPSVFRDKSLAPGFNEMVDMKRLKAE